MPVAFRTVHQPNGHLVTAEGWEYVAFISAAAGALSALGLGRWSIDHRLGPDQFGSPAQRAVLTFTVGTAGAALQLARFWSRPARRPGS